MKQHRLCRRLGPSNRASEEMGQEHLADCSSMGLAVSVCVFRHCASLCECIPVSELVFRCVYGPPQAHALILSKFPTWTSAAVTMAGFTLGTITHH